MPDEKKDRAARMALGEAMFDEVYGGIVSLPEGAARDDYIDDLVGHLFGEIWSRDVLSVRDRRLLLLGASIALGEAGIVEIQMRAARKKGELTDEQLKEVLLFMVNYVGYPRASGLQQALGRIFAEDGDQSA
ncbi:hypothetical protein MB02_12225 [Croceicoccus estronivorus]|uniref:carboxymuconolactone decarboxylase family protein n=1 Tax=Croceicoccus estronivorus TaxID=1172626 RepID=UPI00082BF4C4|nr:carboxymuconolactone decarboxylase family protein [Croceicoccus estronivorus]OCC23378.1 hypothetical protein MB02_12225 [Croceicoccus estronivorus]